MPAFLLTQLLFAIAGQGLADAAEDELLQRLRADYAALLQAKADFGQLRNSGKLGSAEEVDYAGWIRQMGEQVEQDCIVLKRVTITPLPDDLPCDDLPAGGPAPASIDITVESTEAEKTTRMVEQLNSSLGEFDERLLREQDRIKAQTPRIEPAGGGLAGAAGDDGRAAGSEDGGQGEKPARRDGDDGAPGELAVSSEKGAQGKPTPGANSPGEKSAVPDDIPDGSDDDVVARQLREAAEKEADPGLKKKLWEEYRRYKAGIE